MDRMLTGRRENDEPAGRQLRCSARKRPASERHLAAPENGQIGFIYADRLAELFPNRPQYAIRLVRAHQLCDLPKRLIQLKIASVR